MTALFLTAQLVALPCGAACHPSKHRHASDAGNPAEHSCHEQPATEDVRQIAASPTGCTHDHDSRESVLAPTPSPRADHRAGAPAMPAADHMRHAGTASLAPVTQPQWRDPIAPTAHVSSLRI